MVEVKMKYTGDPWIDNGIVAVFDYIDRNEEALRCEKKFSSLGVNINKREFSFSAVDIEHIERYLTFLFERLRDREYKKPSKDQLRYFDKTDNAFKTINKMRLVNIVAQAFAGGDLRWKYNKMPIDQLPDYAVSTFQEWEEKQKDQKRTRKSKDKIVPIGYDKKKGMVYCSEPSIRFVAAGKGKVDLKLAKAQCGFCGQDYSVNITHSNNYPFLVATNNFSNFFSMWKQKIQICSLCELASKFAFNNILFNISNGGKNIFLGIAHASTLEELREFWIDVKTGKAGIELKDLDAGSNLLKNGYMYQGLHETILVCVLELFKGIQKAHEADALFQRVSTKNWHFYGGSKAGKVVSFQQYQMLNEIGRLFEFFSALQNGGVKDFERLIQSFSVQRSKKKGPGQYDRSLREGISQRIVNFSNINNLVERLVFEKEKDIRDRATAVYQLTQFLETYNMEVTHMSPQLFDYCRRLGLQIGEYCASPEGKASVLYDLRNCKSYDKFLSVLERIKFKVGIDVHVFEKENHKSVPVAAIGNPEKGLIRRTNWEECKSLITIYAKDRQQYIESKATNKK